MEDGTAYNSEAPEFTPCFSEVRVARSLVFCIMFSRSLFVIFPFSIMLSVLPRFTNSYYSFDIFKLFKITYHYSNRGSSSHRHVTYFRHDITEYLLHWC
jgi:hypothetical protein